MTTSPDVAHFKKTYVAMREDELGELCERLAQQHDYLSDVARQALREALTERGLTFNSLLKAQARARSDDQLVAHRKHEVLTGKRDRRRRIWEQVMGIAGLGASVVFVVSAFFQDQTIGFIGALGFAGLMAALSLWLLFKKSD